MSDSYICVDAGRKRAKVKDARKDTCSREVLRYDDLKECVELNRIRDHFICKCAQPIASFTLPQTKLNHLDGSVVTQGLVLLQ